MIQAYVMSTFIQKMPSSFNTDTIYISERSVHSSFNVFTKLLDIPREEVFMLKEIYNFYVKTSIVTGILYIQSSPDDCLQRSKKRDFASDNLLSLEYLKQIDYHYKDWLQQTDFPVFCASDCKVQQVPPEVILAEALDEFNKKI